MCTTWDEDETWWRPTPTPLKVYKLVTKERGSPVDPYDRVPQDNPYGSRGTVVEYLEGAILESPEPGFYLYEDLYPALRAGGWSPDLLVIEITIPQGAEVRRGRNAKGERVINSLKVRCGKAVLRNALEQIF